MQASPGNLQQLEDVLFAGTEMSVSTCVMAVKVASDGGGGRRVGVAYVDPSSRRVGVGEFVENDQFSNLEVRVHSWRPCASVVM